MSKLPPVFGSDNDFVNTFSNTAVHTPCHAVHIPMEYKRHSMSSEDAAQARKDRLQAEKDRDDIAKIAVWLIEIEQELSLARKRLQLSERDVVAARKAVRTVIKSFDLDFIEREVSEDNFIEKRDNAKLMAINKESSIDALRKNIRDLCATAGAGVHEIKIDIEEQEEGDDNE